MAEQRSKENGPLAFHEDTPANLLKYVLEFAKDNDPESVINTIDDFCKTKHWMMNVGDEKGKVVEDAIKKHNNPKNILELGTYCGYSAVRIARNLPSDGKVYTIDPNEQIINTISKKIIEKAGLKDKVEFMVGFSQDVIPALTSKLSQFGKFDVVFFDHAKERYYSDLLLLEKLGLIGTGTLLIADNVIVFKINDYLNHVNNGKQYTTHLVYTNLEYCDHIKDGVAISVHL